MEKIIDDYDKRLHCLLSAIDQVFSGIIVTDINGTIIGYNMAASEYEGISKNKALGQSVNNLYMGNKTPGSFKSYFSSCMELKTPILNIVADYATPTGMVINVIQNYYPVIVNNEVIGSFCILNRTDKLEEAIHRIKVDSGFHIETSVNTDFKDIIGSSDVLIQAIDDAKKISAANVDSIIIGETGTGKELFVKSIHNSSSRKEEPLIAVNCATIPENLLESILFGTKKGSYTGSIDSIGLFEVAKKGTLFLDELNTMNLACQSKLLRVIGERKIRKLGSYKEIDVNCTVIGAMNKDPLECIKDNSLRKDLFYRLSVACVSIPPLRERLGDIPKLLDVFIAQNNKKYGKRVKGISKELNDLFMNYNWEGNVRELINVVEGMFILIGEEKILDVTHLSRYHYKHITSCMLDNDFNINENMNLNDTLLNLEQKLIEHTLKNSNGNKSLAAKKLGISPQSLNYKLKKT